SRSARPLVFEQSLEDADRRVERRPRRASLGVAIPSAVGKLFAEQSVDQTADVLVEVRAGGRHLSVDARLYLACEEAIAVTLGRAATLPCHAVADQTHGAAC